MIASDFTVAVIVLTGVIAGQFVIQQHNQACTTDTMLATINQCSSAKSSLDRGAADVTSESREDTPKGCSLYKGKWYFNSHATGELDGESEPICKAGNAMCQL